MKKILKSRLIKSGINPARILRKRKKKAGSPPGSLVFTGERQLEKIRITVIDYDKDTYNEKVVEQIEDIFPLLKNTTTVWINIDGLHQVDVIEKVGSNLNIHQLVLEDILNTEQRPKLEDYSDYLFLTMRVFSFDDEIMQVNSEQISIILGKNFLITFQERIGDVFEPVRERLRAEKGKIRSLGADYLLYALTDAVVDSYFLLLEKLGDKMENLEEQLLFNQNENQLRDIYQLRRELILIRKSIWPMREVLNGLLRRDTQLIKRNTEIYLRDVYDHTIQIMDTIETFRDIIAGIIDTYMTSLSNRMNEVMKVLTIIATIFIPLTFIAGVYGMNFEYFPELGWKWLYPAGFWIIISAIALFMIFYFKKKKWL
ncbi:MAG: magnesium/cobalt transporter CorA [Ignavibacteriaceae bacterium]